MLSWKFDCQAFTDIYAKKLRKLESTLPFGIFKVGTAVIRRKREN